ncbi:MAG TPA: endonuclease/exonuclease/phosphatase family protein [Rhodothermia bacterium]|nr:endonuclease/exonuclease/phosphatase family protein [Rhodothermia bacterium]
MNRTALIVMLGIGLAACADDPLVDSESVDLSVVSMKNGHATPAVTVLTRNMYVGANVDRIIAEPDPNLIPLRVAEEWARLQSTDYPSRARALAEEIVGNQPHLVGLQEVSLFRIQDPADFQLNASDVAIDFLATLVAEITAAGGDYQVVGIVEDTDVELPRLNPDFSLTDVRLTDYDAVLARGDVDVSNVSAVNYQAVVPIPGITIKRGYVALDAEIAGTTYRFVNTHLEPASTFGGFFQGLQAEELIATFAAETKPLIIVGDLNTPAPTSAVYQGFLAAGYKDAWTETPGNRGDGLTCCHVPDLNNARAEFTERIDLVLFDNLDDLLTPGNGSVHATVIGEKPADKTENGLWPSDHAGLTVRFKVASPAS